MEVIKGRMYDYNNGRFLSVDPFIQSPTSTQSMNPYTYIFNNPLSGVDPTGYLSDFSPTYGLNMEARQAFQESASDVVDGIAVAVVATAIVVDQVSDVLAPVKGGAKKVVKEGFKAVKKLFKKPQKATSNGNKNKSQTTTTTQNKDIATTGDQKSATKGDKTYQTYTKKNEKTGETYTGRTSGTKTPEKNVANRDANHHKNDEGFGASKLDKSSTDKTAIRGREQQMIDKNGGAQKQGGTSGNSIRGVAKDNKKAEKYDNAATKEFGSCKPDSEGCK